MTTTEQEIVRVRSRLARLMARLEAAGYPPVGRTSADWGLYPDRAHAVYALEWGPPDADGLVDLLPAVNLGGAIPPCGTPVEFRLDGSRWVFAYDGPAGGGPPR
jgi:hypothetical protein